VTRDDPPMLIVNSDEELVPLGHARHMAARLSMAGVTHRLWVLPGGRHATMYTATALGPSIDFLRRWLRERKADGGFPAASATIRRLSAAAPLAGR
jgi:hypothetical protein